MNNESYFDGTLIQQIGVSILGILVTVCTLGICAPWGFVRAFRWEAEHTVINGKRLAFDGNAFQLFGNWMKWWLFTLLTIGVYSLWAGIALKKWRAKHTFVSGQEPDIY